MGDIGAQQVDRAVAELVRVLGPHGNADWERPAGGLTWTCWETAAHIAHDLTAYAAQLAGLPDDRYLPLDLTVRRGTSVRDLLRVIAACGGLLCTGLRGADPDVRAWHWGPTDPSGFAALGVNEVLMHTYDIVGGLEIIWQPPADLCAAVLGRLFPDAPPGPPADVLLWSTGRGELPGRSRRADWRPRASR